ncbi:MAG TPA: PEGA domain-containing protein [Turneriella sp.]|nr:PEGA domain-containing protein [Turneriella sp.]
MKKLIGFFFLAILLQSLVFGAQDIHEAEKINNDTSGHVLWASEYVLDLYLPQIHTESERSYLGGVVQNLIADELALQRRVITNGKITASVIEYSVRKTDEPLVPNEREELLNRFPKPKVLPLKVVRLASTPSVFSCKELPPNRYSLLTQVSGDVRSVRIDLLLCHGTNALLQKTSGAKEQDLVLSIHRLMNPVRAKITGNEYASLAITTTPSNASVYIDNQFVGKTPLSYSYLIPDKYTLVIKRDGYEPFTTNFVAARGDVIDKSYSLKPAQAMGLIQIDSEPSGAKVYLDADYKGVTPKVLDKLQFGTYRLHVLKEDAGEIYQNIILSEKNSVVKVSASLTEFLAKTPAGFWGISYKGWYWVSLTAAALSFGTAIAFYVWRDDAKEDVYARLSGKSLSMYTADDYAFRDERNAAYKTREDYATGFMVGAGVFAVAAIYFYVQSLLSADEGIVMNKTPSKAKGFDFAIGASVEHTDLTLRFRF